MDLVYICECIECPEKPERDRAHTTVKKRRRKNQPKRRLCFILSLRNENGNDYYHYMILIIVILCELFTSLFFVFISSFCSELLGVMMMVMVVNAADCYFNWQWHFNIQFSSIFLFWYPSRSLHSLNSVYLTYLYGINYTNARAQR